MTLMTHVGHFPFYELLLHINYIFGSISWATWSCCSFLVEFVGLFILSSSACIMIQSVLLSPFHRFLSFVCIMYFLPFVSIVKVAPIFSLSDEDSYATRYCLIISSLRPTRLEVPAKHFSVGYTVQRFYLLVVVKN